MLARSRQRAQCLAQLARAANQPLDLGMCIFPDRVGPGQQRPPGLRQSKTPAAAVLLVDRDFQEAPPFERLEIRRKRGAIQDKQGSDTAECRRLRPIERHQQRELTVGEIERPQDFIEAACQRACRTMNVQTQAGITHQVGRGERQFIIFTARI